MLDPNPSTKIADPSQLLLAPKPEDAPLALAHMGRWRWKMGGKDVAFTRELSTIFDLDIQSFSPSLSAMRDLVSTRDMSRLIIIVNRLIQEGRDGVGDCTPKQPARENVEFSVNA